MASTVTISGVVVEAETDSAILCDIEGEEIWIPKSQIDDDSEVYEMGTNGDLVITQWIARKKGLED
jgi:hypothetical protein